MCETYFLVLDAQNIIKTTKQEIDSRENDTILILIFCCITAWLYAKYQNDWTTETYVLAK